MKPEDPPRFPIDRFARKQPWCFRGKDADGRKLCYAGCGRPVGPRRSSSCSGPCVAAWESVSNANLIRFRVEARDKGVCALCNVDTVKLKAEWATAILAYDDAVHAGYSEAYRKKWLFNRHWTTVLRVLCTDPKCPRPPVGFPAEDRRWWEADHVIPVIEGGGGCDHSGYRTLCIPCHRSETAALAARRATKRRAAKAAIVPELDFNASK